MEAIVGDVLAAHPGQVAEFRSGKEKVLGFLVGEVMKASHGKANPKMANELLRERLQSGHPA
jgi:aspartyl-tRNA(Asn)/glutamyl-tRNA(Gln) amidotransferase subunit B